MSPDAMRILADLKRHATAFHLDADGLGESLCKAFTDGVQASIDAGQAPDGSAWPELSDAYAEWKGKQYPGQAIGHLHDLMADPHQVAGDVIIPNAATAFVTYGTTEDAREEAAAFQEGDPAANRPPRPFWGFTADSTVATTTILEARLKKIVG